MIQRLQTIWLVLATAFNALTFKLPFYSGDWTRDVTPQPIDLNAGTTPWLTGVTALTGVLALATVFLYRNRKLQLKLCYLGIFLTLALLTIYFLEIAHFRSGNVALWALFYFAILGCFVLALRGILKDEKLIRSMDRLR
jgi:hypothetical protein